MIKGNTITIEQVTDSEVQELINELKANHTQVSVQGPNVFQIDGHGIKATATLFNDDLVVVINSKSFWLPMAVIEDGLNKAIGNEQKNFDLKGGE